MKTHWPILFFLIATAVYVVVAHASDPHPVPVLISVGSATVAFLLLVYLFIRIGHGPQNRSVTVAWLVAFGCLSVAVAALIRADETGISVFRVMEILFAAVALFAIPVMFGKWSASGPHPVSKDDSDLMLAGSGMIVIAVVLDFIATFCPPGEECAGFGWPELNLTHRSSILFLAGAVVVMLRVWRGRERMPRILASDVFAAVLALFVFSASLWDLKFRLNEVIWFAAGLIMLYSVYRDIRKGSRIGDVIAPELIWSRLGALALVGIILCDVALYLRWFDLGEYTIRSPQMETGHWSIYSVQFLALMAVPLALMVRPPKFRPAASIAAVVLALAVAASWIWRIQLIRNGVDAMKTDGDLSTPPAAMFHLGSAVFGVGVLLVLAAAVGVTIRDRVAGIHLPGRRETIGSSP